MINKNEQLEQSHYNTEWITNALYPNYELNTSLENYIVYIFFLSKKQRRLKEFLELFIIIEKFRALYTERFFKNQVFTLYVIQAQCRDSYKLKPRFLG